jgi:hypothetical protein
MVLRVLFQDVYAVLEKDEHQQKRYSSSPDVAAGIRAQVSTATTWNSHH